MISRANCIIVILLTIPVCAVHVSAENTSSQPTVSFLDKEEAKAAIIDDSLEKYFDQLQPMEMAAKTGSPVEGTTIEEQREQCRKRYQAGVLSFTEKEKAAIKWHVDKLIPILTRDYPLFGKVTWSFLKVSGNIEGGLPHTRGCHIVLSQSMCRRIEMIRQIPAARMLYMSILELFIHEQMHVFQRTHKGHLDSLYTELWGFTKASTITGCEWLTEHHLANPDGVDCSWVLPVKEGSETSYLWPLVVFAEGDRVKNMPGDFRMVAISLRKTEDGFAVQLTDDGKPVSRNLNRVPQFKELFPFSSNIYHPNEASADMFSTLVMVDSFLPQANLPPERKLETEKTFAPLRKWFKENLKTRQEDISDEEQVSPQR